MNRTDGQTATAACTLAKRWHEGAREISEATLNVYGNRFIADLAAHAPVIDRFSRGTGSILARATEGYTVTFARTGKDNGLDVDVNCRRLIVNRDYFDGIAGQALNSYSYRLDRRVSVRRLIRSVTRSAVRLIMGHELCHPQQGLTTISIVRNAATAIGWHEIAKFDVDADMRGGAIESTLSALDDGQATYEGVLHRFEDALAFQLRYCVPAFGCPAEKPHKRSRVAALAIQLARIVVANRGTTGIDRDLFSSLTMPIYVTTDERYSKVGIVGLDPMVFLGSAEFDDPELSVFFGGLDSGNVEEIVKRAITLCVRLGLISM